MVRRQFIMAAGKQGDSCECKKNADDGGKVSVHKWITCWQTAGRDLRGR